MDRGIKFLLAVIAVSLIILNLQKASVSVLPEARAESFDDYSAIERGLDSVEDGLNKCAEGLEEIAKSIRAQTFN